MAISRTGAPSRLSVALRQIAARDIRARSVYKAPNNRASGA